MKRWLPFLWALFMVLACRGLIVEQAITPLPTRTATNAPPLVTPILPHTPSSSSVATVYWLAYQGRTEDGLPFLGNPDAPVSLIEYTDFM